MDSLSEACDSVSSSAVSAKASGSESLLSSTTVTCADASPEVSVGVADTNVDASTVETQRPSAIILFNFKAILPPLKLCSYYTPAYMVITSEFFLNFPYHTCINHYVDVAVFIYFVGKEKVVETRTYVW